MVRMGRGEISEVIQNENERRGGRLNRWIRAAEELCPINIHKYRWLVVVAKKILKN